jgi:transcriptional regulator with XRE-family HTH domain
MSDPSDSSPRRALADFMRAHRLRLTPASVGLAAGSRRRTPGLRREEVAQLSGISATWYSWAEQGRDVSMSPAALARLSETFHLSPAERAYFFDLAGKRDPANPLADSTTDVPPALAGMLDGIGLPAYVLDRLWRARAWNAAAAELFVGWLDAGCADRNLLRFMFLDPKARQLIQDWEDRARRLLAEFRLDFDRHLDDPEMNALVDDLGRDSPFFRAAWDDHVVTGREGGLRRFLHPARGLLCYEQVTFNLSSRPEFKLVTLVGIPDGSGD